MSFNRKIPSGHQKTWEAEEEEWYDEDEEGEEEEDFEDQLAALTPTLSPTNIVVQLLIVYPLDTSGFPLRFQLAGGYVETSYNSDRYVIDNVCIM